MSSTVRWPQAVEHPQHDVTYVEWPEHPQEIEPALALLVNSLRILGPVQLCLLWSWGEHFSHIFSHKFSKDLNKLDAFLGRKKMGLIARKEQKHVWKRKITPFLSKEQVLHLVAQGIFYWWREKSVQVYTSKYWKQTSHHLQKAADKNRIM